MIKIGFVSLGCVKNLVDTEVMLGLLKENAMSLTVKPEEADVLIVNTCTFIKSAKEESITTILNMAEYKLEGRCKSLIVAGCLGERYGQELLDEMPEIDAIIGTGAWRRIVEAVNETLQGRRVILLEAKDTIYDEKTPRIITTPAHSAYVKIAEGCNNCCSYCVIPKVRGQFRSRTIESVVAEATRLVANGAKEINIIAQDTTSYGIDRHGRPQLVELLRELVKIPELQWLRILYCYPKYFSDELIDLIADEPKICKYVDLPLQHANDNILQKMNRRDTRADIETLLTKIRQRIPGVAIRSSFIVGFPGETDEEFNDLKDFVVKYKFDKVGIFTYSQEEDTPAFAMADQITEEVKQERYHELMSQQCKISETLNQSLEGRTLDVLVEGRDAEHPDISYGRSYREAPEIDGQVYVENDTHSKRGDIIKVQIAQGFTYDVVGERIE